VTLKPHARYLLQIGQHRLFRIAVYCYGSIYEAMCLDAPVHGISTDPELARYLVTQALSCLFLGNNEQPGAIFDWYGHPVCEPAG
jgi:hypothetical protein